MGSRLPTEFSGQTLHVGCGSFGIEAKPSRLLLPDDKTLSKEIPEDCKKTAIESHLLASE
jgi:hypothetical protein